MTRDEAIAIATTALEVRLSMISEAIKGAAARGEDFVVLPGAEPNPTPIGEAYYLYSSYSEALAVLL